MTRVSYDNPEIPPPVVGSLAGRRVLIIVENLPLPFDRRVWQEAHVLRNAGATVSIICPKRGEYSKSYELLDGIHIHRHPLPTEASGKMAFVLEYAGALFWETLLAWKIFFTRGFDVIQGCNPPDLIFLVALPFRLFGKRFVFDHHDSAPELYLAKFGRRDAFHRLLCLIERWTFRTASRVITANESYRQHAIAIGPHPGEDITAVYSVPELSRMRRVEPDPVLRARADTILGYVGIIADQDGLDHLVDMMRTLADMGATENVHAVVVGDGPALASVKAMAEKLGVADLITFTGYLRGEALLAALSCFDIGIIPDPMNPYNDKISMNKVFEYSALGVPSVAYNLAETHRLLGETASYADEATPASLARACIPLIDDKTLREKRGVDAKTLADAKFVWTKEADKYLGVYEALLPGRARAISSTPLSTAEN